MSRRSLWASLCFASVVGGVVAACSSGGSPAANDAAADAASGTPEPDGAVSNRDGSALDAPADGAGLGLLVDNMTARKGTQISLQVPAGRTPGSYYTYSDFPAQNATGDMSVVLGTNQLVETPVSPPVVNADGSQIVGDLCFSGEVVEFAGLGMNLVYGNPPDASPESGLSQPVPFDASHYSGVSFYILVSPTDASAPSIHFGVPDTQTADPQAFPTSDCAVLDGGVCDDDFGSDVPVTPGTWTRVAFTWDQLTQQGFGTPFTAIKQSQLIGMKWQANGGGVEAGVDSFNFCISDIYFTP